MRALREIDRREPVFRQVRDTICSDGMIDDLIAPYWFDKETPLQSVIHALKYQDIPAVGEAFGRHLGRVVRSHAYRPTIILPVPLHKAKLREREYNQAAVVASGVSSIVQKPVCESILFRVRYTQTQTELTAAERKQNVEDAFALRERPQDKKSDLRRILLVDDVVTTGATARSVASLLKSRGCESVFLGTVAVAARSA